MANTFFYFAYGSNLLAQRIHINNPSAIRAGIGKLKDYQLDFVTYSQRWRGASATIINTPGREVWGAIWEIDLEHMQSLDDQEGVKDDIYSPMNVDIILPDGNMRKCRVYEQCTKPNACVRIENLEDVRKPSQIYLTTIQRGAVESGLPEFYQKFLSKIPHNGYCGDVDIGANLNLK